MPFLNSNWKWQNLNIKGKIYMSLKHTWVVKFHKNFSINGQVTTAKRLFEHNLVYLSDNVIEYFDSGFTGSSFQIKEIVENLKIVIIGSGYIGHRLMLYYQR